MSLTSIPLPPGELILTTEVEAHFPMRSKDWERLRAKVVRMQKRRREFSSFAWAMVGIAISTALVCVVWVPAFDVLPTSGQLSFAWVTPMLISVAVGTAIMAALGFWGSHLLAGQESVSATELLADMDLIHAPQH